MVRSPATLTVGRLSLLTRRAVAQRSWARNSRPCASSAQTIRAFLLASATAATFGWRRPSSPAQPDVGIHGLALRRQDHRARAMDQQRAQVASPRLLMPSSVGLPPLECCRGTSPSQAATCRPLSKLFASPIDGDQRTGGDRADARDLLELPAELAAAMPRLDLGLELVDLPIQLLEVLEQATRSAAGTSPAARCSHLRAARHALGDVSDPCGMIRPNSPSRPRI